jgi:hypothetical protein
MRTVSCALAEIAAAEATSAVVSAAIEDGFMMAVPENDNGADATGRFSARAIEEPRLFLSRRPYKPAGAARERQRALGRAGERCRGER